MSDQANIPTLTDLIEKGIEIKMSDLGLEDDLQFGAGDDDDGDDFDTTQPDFSELKNEPKAAAEPAANPFANHPGLEMEIRRILDKHLELAFEEIKQTLRRTRK